MKAPRHISPVVCRLAIISVLVCLSCIKAVSSAFEVQTLNLVALGKQRGDML